MKFEVTEKHIKCGARCMGNSCPIALAIIARLPDARVFVDKLNISIDHCLYETPYWVSLFIHNYDRLNPVQPFSFELELRLAA